MSDHDRPGRRWRRCEPLQTARSADAVRRQLADLLPEPGRDGRDGVVVLRLHPHDTGRLRRPEADREHGAERDRDLTEDIARVSLADDTLDPVDELDRLDPPLEQAEERTPAALVHRVLARNEPDVRGGAREPLPLGSVQLREDRERGDLVGRHHGRHRSTGTMGPPLPGGMEASTASRAPPPSTRQRYRGGAARDRRGAVVQYGIGGLRSGTRPRAQREHAESEQVMMQVRVARPTRDLGAARSFYGELLGMPVLASFEDHDGYSGVVFGLPDSWRQLEVVSRKGVTPSPTAEDQLVLYLGSADEVARAAARIHAAGFEPAVSPNPYWARAGAVCFVDPDGYWIVLSPQAW